VPIPQPRLERLLAERAGAPALREALARWFGTPPNTTLPIIDRPS
jgi:hypothetical protein